MEIKTFDSIDTFIKEHVRTILEEADYQGKDENGDPFYEHKKDYPIITYSATHKVGGTNTSIVYRDSIFVFQSRNSILKEGTNTSDQNGFRFTFEKKDLRPLFLKVINKYNLTNKDEIVIYGEWCGYGIKDNHSISKAESKQWIIFALKINDQYVDNFLELCDEENSIYNILKWGIFKLSIDYNQFKFGCWKDSNGDLPKDLQELVNQHTLPCPVSKSFGVEGKGEGLVLVSEDYISKRTGKKVQVKIKNSEYDKISNKPVIEKTNHPDLDLFLKEALSGGRLEQFINKLINEGNILSMTLVKDYQNLILEDIKKECSRSVQDLNLTERDYESAVRKGATDYFRTKIN